MSKKKFTPYKLTMLDEIMASPVEPLPLDKRRQQITHMLQGMAAIERDEKPTVDDWRRVSDALNHLETLIDVMKVAKDENGLLQDAMIALVGAGRRHQGGMAMRLDGPGLRAVRAMLDDYIALVDQLPARTIIKAQRLTERRVRAIQSGKRQTHDEVMDL